MKFDLDLPIHPVGISKIQGIYFLIDEDQEVVYIGKSVDIISRVSAHVNNNNKTFTTFSYIEMNISDSLLSEIESDLIAIYRPKYNKGLSQSNRYRECTEKFGNAKFDYPGRIKIGNRVYVDLHTRTTGEDIISTLKK